VWLDLERGLLIKKHSAMLCFLMMVLKSLRNKVSILNAP
jgi:hypothetical protein